MKKVSMPKMVKLCRHFESKAIIPTDKGAKPALVVDLDKNMQICGGTFVSTHRGRPCKFENGQLLCPVTSWNDDSERYEFVEYEVLIPDVK